MPTYPLTGVRVSRAPARITALYLAFGLLWIWLSDRALVWLGYGDDHAFLAAAGKGTAFVAVTAVLLFWLVRREVAAVRRSERLLRAVLDGTTDAVFVKDRDGRYLLANGATVRFIGRPVADVLGRNDLELFEAASAERLLANDRAILTGGEVVTLEETLTSAGVSRTYQTTKAPYRDATGTVVGLVGVARDISDRKRAEEALRETEARLREAQRIARLGSWGWEPPTDRVWWSDAEFELFGVDRQVVNPSFTAFLALVHPDDRAVAVARVEAMRGGADEFANDLRIVRPDGAIMWLHSRARATRNAGGTLISVEGTDQDITGRRLSEMAVRESEERLQAAVEVARLGVIVVDYDRQTADLSPRAAEQFGLTPGVRVTRADLHARFHPDDRAELERQTASALEPSGTGWFSLEHRVVRPDGTTRWLNVRKQVTFAGNRPHRAVVVTQDVTERRLAEEALRASEMRYRLLFESNPHPMWLYDVDSFGFLAVNDAAVLAYGYSRDEFLAMTIRVIRPAEDVSQLEAIVAQLTPSPTRSSQWRHLRKNGEVFHVDVSSHELPGEDGRSRLVLALDITERLRAEQARDELLARLQLYLDRMPIAYVLLDADTRCADWNPAAENIFGYTREEIIGQPVQVLVHPDDRVHVDTIEHRLRTGDVEAQSVNRNVTKDGRVITCEWHNTPLFTPSGAFLGVLSMALDITERVRTAERVRASEERLRMTLSAAQMGTFDWDIPNNAIVWSDTHYELFGYPPDVRFPVEYRHFAEPIHPDDRARVEQAVRAAMETRTPYACEFRLPLPDGRVRWVAGTGNFHYAADGRAMRMIGTAADVTERKTAEIALRASEERLRLALEAGQMGTFDWDLATNAVVWSDTHYELFGYPPGDRFRVEFRHFADRIHPDDRARVEADLGAARDGRPYANDCRIILPDGTVRWVQGRGEFTYADDGRPVRMLGTAQDITDRKRAEAELMMRDRAIQALSQGIVITDPTQPDNPIIYVSPGFERLSGYSAAEVVGRNCRFMLGKDTDKAESRRLGDAIRAGDAYTGEILNCRKDGTTFWNALSIDPVRDAGGRLTQFIGIETDISARRSLEEQFRQAQKMEAVGRLAGGVAHDFNNLLTVINGYSELMLMGLPPDDGNRPAVSAVLDAGERAAGLTAQLLAFSRKAVAAPRVLDVRDAAASAEQLLRRLIGEDVALSLALPPHPCRIVIDPNQFDQVLLNLAVNARDAMPAGGRLGMAVEAAAHPGGVRTPLGDLPPGRYVEMAVTDTGCGMTDEVKAKIFEPFFTTKEMGKGTGLGLAVVHGVVQQAGGGILIESAVGAGTTFRLLFPESAAPTTAVAAADLTATAAGTETILLVEDEESVRMIGRIALESQGYRVLEAECGADALRVAEGAGDLHLLVSDMVMPEMNGRELADALRHRYPALRVLFVSGYTDDMVFLDGVRNAVDAFLQKPFSPLGLARKVREVLDAPAR